MNPLTAVVGRFHAHTFDLCKEGALVQFTFPTAGGKVFVTAPLAEFVLKCRGPVDSNLRPLPAHQVFPPRAAAVVNPAAPLPVEAPPSPPEKKVDRRLLPAGTVEKYQLILSEFQEGKFSTLFAAARAHGAQYSRFITWKTRQPRGDVRYPVTKPGGKLL